MDFEVLTKNLEKKGYKVSCFATKEEAAAYLNKEIDGMTVSSGGSMTVKELGLADMLRTHNDFKWHWEGDDRMDVLATDVYLSSVNGMAETGEIVNIDGMGNRLAGTLFGHKKLYFIVGRPGRCGLAGTQRRRAEERHALQRQDALRGQRRGQVLRLQESGAHLQGAAGVLGEA